MKDLRALLQHEVQDLYSAETQWVQVLPKFSRATKNSRLKQTLDKSLSETQQQKERLERVAELMHFKAQGVKSLGMEGLIREGSKVLQDKSQPPVRDAELISAAQKAEHYQIAGYCTARTYAQLIGEGEIADLLGKCLTEVRDADHLLTDVALARVN
jgi:ferritin-like metal-binding protein YciE